MPKLSKPVQIVFWLVAPFALIITDIILYALVNFVVTSTSKPSGDQLFAPTPVWATVINIVLFIIGAVAVLLVPVGIVAAIITASRKPTQPVNVVPPLTPPPQL